MNFDKYYKEKPGDDSGMQTRVWGPAGWLFLHSVAQNYPWKPTDEQKKNYLNFFTVIGKVLPCRYCRESYVEYIKNLNISTMESRLTLTKWLYDIHNKVNDKLDVSSKPCFDEVWQKYESFRSKCTKSTEKQNKKGCVVPMDGGYKKQCKITISSFGAEKNKQVKLVSITKSQKAGKKYKATFVTGERQKVIHFGAKGMSDYTIHKDPERKKRYIQRHKKDLRTKNPTRAGFLSMFVLWNKKSLKASIADYKKRLNVYNKSGKFPTKL